MKVLLLGASGIIAPNLMEGLEPYYDFRFADINPHPGGKQLVQVDVREYDQVLEASKGMDAIMNFTVIRPDPVLSFHVNTLGALHVMKAAAELGIKKVVHTGPQVTRQLYDHDFDITDVPRVPGTGYYGLTKVLSYEICRIYAKTYGIQTVCFVFNSLGLEPSEGIQGQDFPPFRIFWKDLQHACRLALDIKSVPDDYQDFNMLSMEAHGKYNVDKARRVLGFEPTQRWEDFYKRKA